MSQGPTEELQQRRKSLCLRSPNRETFCHDVPLDVTEASPRRDQKSRFRVPGMGIIKAGLSGFSIRHTFVKKTPTLWLDSAKDEGSPRVAQRCQSMTALKDRSKSKCDVEKSTDDIQIILSDSVFNMSGPLQRSTIKLSRLPETEAAYMDSNGNTPHAMSGRNSGRLQLRSSASSMANMTPRIPKRPQENKSKYPAFVVDLPVDDQVAKLRRSVSQADLSTPTQSESPFGSIIRPQTRLDSRLRSVNLSKGEKPAHVVPEGPSSTSSLTTRSTDSISDQINSFRSDQALYPNSLSYGELNRDIELPPSSRSDWSALKNFDARSMQRNKAHMVQTSDAIGMDTKLADSIGEALTEILSDEDKDSQKDDDCSILDEPKNLGMWLDWLEERADVTRKEILYRMGCQRAFVQEAQEEVRSFALCAKELEDVFDPRLPDRLAVLRRKCINRGSTRRTRRRESIDDDSIVDINLDEGAPRLLPRVTMSLDF